MTTLERRIHSFVWGGVAAAVFIGLGLYLFCSTADITDFLFYGIIGVFAYTFVSCLILNNNFIGELVLDIWSWGFVQLPGIIFTLDLDGIIWLLTVKLLFWILGLILALLCGILALIIGGFISIFVYPFALVSNIKNKSEVI